MSGRVGHRKRLICLSADDVLHGRIQLTEHLDLFDAGGRRAKGVGRAASPLRLHLAGADSPIETDIHLDSATGRPRPRFRRQAWVKGFFERHQLRHGDTVCIERVGKRDFRIYPFESRTSREASSTHRLEPLDARGHPTVIELFAGCGGMALGFKRAGFKTVLANEWDSSACATLRANVTERVLNCAIQEIRRFPRADVVAGGPPCQGFSNLGERVPNDPRNQLWRQFLRCVAEACPKVFVLENVPPLLKSGEFVEFSRLAKAMGYDLDARVLNAADYGVPQTRKRAIVIGSRVGKPQFPLPTHGDPASRAKQFLAGIAPWVTVRDAIGHLSAAPTGLGWHIGRNPTTKSLQRYRSIPPGGNRWDLPRRLMPECWKRKLEGGTDLMGRLWWDRPSVTIRTEFYKPEKGRYLHPQAHRPITHLEAALLQGFPENYEFIGSRIDVGVQIGNAVPPLLAQAIAARIAVMVEGTGRMRRAQRAG